MRTNYRVVLALILCASCIFVETASAQDTVTPTSSASATAVPSNGAQAAVAAPRSLAADLFVPLKGDFRQMSAEANWLIAGIGVGAAAVTHSWDHEASQFSWPAGSTSLMSPARYAGDSFVQMGGAMATYALGRVTDSPKLAQLGGALFRAQVLSEVTSDVIKLAARRTRPDGTSLSFPSGHSSAAFATATVLQSEFGWKVGVPSYAFATWVAASRVEMRRHFLSDVVAGATIGILAGRSVTVGTTNTRFAMGPMVVPGGLGIGFSKLNK